jgi:hypothetical protein
LRSNGRVSRLAKAAVCQSVPYISLSTELQLFNRNVGCDRAYFYSAVSQDFDRSDSVKGFVPLLQPLDSFVDRCRPNLSAARLVSKGVPADRF